MTTTADYCQHGAPDQHGATQQSSKPLSGKARKRELDVAAINIQFTSVKSACLCCRKSRVKCDKMLPCFRCRRLGLDCNPQLRGRGRPPVNRNKKAAAEASAAAAAAEMAANRRTSISSLSSTASPTSSTDQHQLSHANKKQRTSFMLNMPGELSVGGGSSSNFWPQTHQQGHNNNSGRMLTHGKNRQSLSFNDALCYLNTHNTNPAHAQAQALTAVPPTPFCVAVRSSVVRFFEKQLVAHQPQPEQHPHVRRYLQMLWHVGNKERCGYLENLVTYVASHIGLMLDTSSNANGDTSALDVSTAVKSIPRERHMRVAWDTNDAAYWERTVFYGHSSSHTNDKWNKLIYSAADGATAAASNQGDLLSLVVHPDDLSKLCDGMVDAHTGRNDDGSTATNVARVRVFNGMAYDLGVISTSLFVSADGRLAHFCVRVKLADQPTFIKMQQQHAQHHLGQHQGQQLRGGKMEGGMPEVSMATSNQVVAATAASSSNTTASFDNNSHLDPALRRLSYAPFNALDTRRLSMSSQFSFSDLLTDRRNSFVDLIERRQSWSFPPLSMANSHGVSGAVSAMSSIPTSSMALSSAAAGGNNNSNSGSILGSNGSINVGVNPAINVGGGGAGQTLSSLSSMGLDTLGNVQGNPFTLRK